MNDLFPHSSSGKSLLIRPLSPINLLPLDTQYRKGARQGSVEEITHSELGRNRRSTGSSSVVLGWHCYVSAACTFNMSQVLWGNSLCFFWPCTPLFCSDSSYSLLADDVLGSYLLCPHPKKPKCGSLIVRFPSGLVTHLVENTRKGKFLIEVKRLSFLDKVPFGKNTIITVNSKPFKLNVFCSFLT